MTVTFNGTTYECSEAVKGSDFILLYDSNKTMIASFFKITDFSLFSIDGGDWTPYAEESIIVRSATLSGGVIALTGYSEIGDGTTIKLIAPGASDSVTQGIRIDGNVFSIVDTMGKAVAGKANCWAQNAMIALMIDKTNQKAYLLNPAVSNAANEHIANKNNPHGVTASQVGADPAGSAEAVQKNLDALTPGKIGAAVTSRAVDVTLLASSWSSATPPTLTVAVSGLGAAQNGTIGVAKGATQEQRKAAAAAQVGIQSQAEGTLTLVADGTKPTINIPATVILLG